MISDKKKTLYLKIKKQKTPVWIYGNEDNPKIFFIHGYFRGFSEMIGDLPPRYLKKDYCVIAFDLPGYGQSNNIIMDDFEFVSKVIRELTNSSEKIILFGLSYGGLLSLQYSLKYPTNIKCLIIAGLPYFYGYRKIVSIIKLFPLIKKENKSISVIVKKLLKLNNMNFSKIKAPVLFLYSSKDHYATHKMGIELDSKFNNSEIFIINKYNHKWLMHDIKESGFLIAINKYIK